MIGFYFLDEDPFEKKEKEMFGFGFGDEIIERTIVENTLKEKKEEENNAESED